eukprot:CAMPEP_0178913586 /NCGR_PEP_ID=MMETSP0786-20121207/10926_1 /TAXON_ID=186022 /ORGANISM="Thalassionema frauenfeldii, Strain CCMP 1798" /LENGTH=273 /DNA_ID=CAMNT_0020586347 /DNA_START=64 /DNA_END=885 /DNA_ORIENTATION=-
MALMIRDVLVMMILSTAASNFFPPARCQQKTTLRLLQSFRGGNINSDSIGILDLRPNEPAPVDVLGSHENNRSQPYDACLLGQSIGIFSLGNGVDDDYNQEAAAAETVGMHCSTICCLLSYDATKGSTNLHRAAGIKLATLMNGIRRRDEGKGKTKILLLLYSNSKNEELKDNEWKLDGAEHLISRLRAFHSMGNDDENKEKSKRNDDDPFAQVQIVPVTSSDNRGIKRQTWETLESLNSHKLTEEELAPSQSIFQQAFKTAGGEGTLTFSRA